MLPSTLASLDKVDWIPVDMLADVIIEFTGVADAQSLETATGALNETAKLNGAGFVRSQESSSSLSVYHAINPQATSWAHLLPRVAKNLRESVKIVSWIEWLEALRRSQRIAMVEDLKMNPGLKLLPFYESLAQAEAQGKSMPVLDTQLSRTKSRTLSSLQSVSVGWMDMWLRQWDI
jgi:hypothetical protein